MISRLTRNILRKNGLRGLNKVVFSRGFASAGEPVEDYDVVIVGGGPVGLALACALSTHSFSKISHWHLRRLGMKTQIW